MKADRTNEANGTDDAQEVKRGRGRPAGSISANSLTWLIDKLECGEKTLEPDREGSDWVRRFCLRSVASVKAIDPKREFTVTLCHGLPVEGGTSFRFYCIERTK